ncbi:MAG TPA: tRNA modification GTPase [Pirellulaceae bacterium]|nr:tRNA modification GTPase [Pirellulaceae bacterium]
MSAAAFSLDDTIVAIASPPGHSVRGIVRLSGPHLVDCLSPVVRIDPGSWQVRRARARSAEIDLESGCTVSGRLLLWPPDRSYTRQPLAEFHTWGSPALLRAMVVRFCQHGARIARAGEFTLRAFLSGRIDLVQAEAVFNLVAASRQSQFDQALRESVGMVLDPLRRVRSELLNLLADLEAGLDFVDEDIEFIDQRTLQQALESNLFELQQASRQLSARTTDDTPPRVVIVGPPNAGKSSLLNALIRESRAMVSPLEGTTTDFVSARVTWQGKTLDLVDTAGWQSTADCGVANDQDAIRLQQSQVAMNSQVEQSDMILICCDASHTGDGHAVGDWRAPHDSFVQVVTKADLPIRRAIPGQGILVSSYSGQGLDELREKILEKIDSRIHNENVGMSASRCQFGLQQAIQSLQCAMDMAAASGDHELIAVELRSALDALGEVVGVVYTDELLDRIFSRFCIGK